MERATSSKPFVDSAGAEGNLARAGQRLAPTLARPLHSLLAQSPDPDGTLRLIVQYLDAASPEVLRGIVHQPIALTYLVTLFGHCESLGDVFTADPALPVQFARDRHFTRLKAVDELMQDYARFSVTSPDPWFSSQLARFKRRNYARIALKDVLGIATLSETTLELSTLADVVVKQALAYCDQELEKRHGRPQQRDSAGRIARTDFSVVSLGKLGGNELNYSPDIALLFLYGHSGETAGAGGTSVISNKEYCVRLAEAIVRTISQVTPHGDLYRVDLSFRPDGQEGDLAIALRSALEYYDHRARDSELHSLVKARHSAGEARLTREFLHGVAPYVYQAPSNLDDLESALQAQAGVPGPSVVGPERSGGLALVYRGIREIEFLAQYLEQLHGRDDAWLRVGGTLLALRRLNDKRILTDAEYARLTSAYEFFRKVEHRVQWAGAPGSPAGQNPPRRLAQSLGIQVSPPAESGSILNAEFENAFSSVNGICRSKLRPQAVPT